MREGLTDRRREMCRQRQMVRGTERQTEGRTETQTDRGMEGETVSHSSISNIYVGYCFVSAIKIISCYSGEFLRPLLLAIVVGRPALLLTPGF